MKKIFSRCKLNFFYEIASILFSWDTYHLVSLTGLVRNEFGDLKNGILSGPNSPTKGAAATSMSTSNLMTYYGRSMSLDRQDRIKSTPEDEKRR